MENQNVLSEHQGMPSDVVSAGAAIDRAEKRQLLNAANVEIDELKHGLRYAEFQLARLMQEKEQLQQEKNSDVFQIGDLHMKLRQRDIEYQ
jgi:hypothetical protein